MPYARNIPERLLRLLIDRPFKGKGKFEEDKKISYYRDIVGWAARDRINTEFLMKALDPALEKRNQGRVLILHSDKVSRYTSDTYQTKICDSGIIYAP